MCDEADKMRLPTSSYPNGNPYTYAAMTAAMTPEQREQMNKTIAYYEREKEIRNKIFRDFLFPEKYARSSWEKLHKVQKDCLSVFLGEVERPEGCLPGIQAATCWIGNHQYILTRKSATKWQVAVNVNDYNEIVSHLGDDLAPLKRY